MILTYNLSGTPAQDYLRFAGMKYRQKVRAVFPSEYEKPLSELAGPMFQGAAALSGSPKASLTSFAEPMVVFCGVSQADMAQILDALKTMAAPAIALKAVLTPANAGWSSLYLYEKLKEEHLQLEGPLPPRGGN